MSDAVLDLKERRELEYRNQKVICFRMHTAQMRIKIQLWIERKLLWSPIDIAQ
jgi:hypothetical protein